MLAWWDEPVDELDACVRSLAPLCDGLVAVDGAYKMTPGATISSPPEQADAIRDAAEAVGIDARVIIPKKLWTGQVAKRDYMLKIAAKNADWLLAIDADHRVRCDGPAVRHELEALRDNAESVKHGFYTPLPMNGTSNLKRLAPHEWHLELAGRNIPHCLLFRKIEDMRVEKEHWGYTGTLDGQRIAVGSNWHCQDYPYGRVTELRADLRIDHVCFDRDQMRLDRNRDYCKTRDEFRVANGYEP